MAGTSGTVEQGIDFGEYAKGGRFDLGLWASGYGEECEADDA